MGRCSDAVEDYARLQGMPGQTGKPEVSRDNHYTYTPF